MAPPAPVAGAQVFRAPAPEEIGRFVGVETILDWRVVEGGWDLSVLDAGGQRIEVAQAGAPGEWVRLCLRAEDVTLFPGAPKPAASSAFNRLAGHVLRMVPTGAYMRVTVDCGFRWSPHDAAVIEEMELRDGAPVTAHFKSTAPHLMRRVVGRHAVRDTKP